MTAPTIVDYAGGSADASAPESDTVYLTGTGNAILVIAAPYFGASYDPMGAVIDGVTATVIDQGDLSVYSYYFAAKREGSFSGTTPVKMTFNGSGSDQSGLCFAAILLDGAEIGGSVYSTNDDVSHSGSIPGGADDLVVWIAQGGVNDFPGTLKSGNSALIGKISATDGYRAAELGYGARALGLWGLSPATNGISITLVNITGTTPTAPVAVNDAATFAMSTTGNLVDVLANDTGGIDQTTLTITGGTVASGRRSVVSDGGTYKISVDGPGSVGTETVTYTVDDTSSGTSNVGTLTITWTDPSAVQTVSVQHGVITTGGTSATGTITAVDTARSFARIVASKADFGLAGGNASESFNEFTGKVALTNATTVTASRLASSTTADFRVPYEVWTVDGEAVALRWVGSVTIGSGQTTADSAAISGIDGIGQCVPILTYQQLNSTSKSQGDAAIATVEMIESGGITVRATRGNSTDSLEVGVAVIEFLHDDFVVHKVSGTVGTGSPAAFALGSTVTWDECWYTHSFRAALNSLEEHTVLITELADSGVSRIGVEQYGGNAGTAIVYVVEDTGGGIDSSRVATSTDSNADGEALSITPVSDVGIATVHVSATLSGTGTAYPRTLYGASLTGSGTVTKYVAQTGNALSYRARVTEWPTKSVATPVTVMIAVDGWSLSGVSPGTRLDLTVSGEIESWSSDGYPASAESRIALAIDAWSADDVAPATNARTSINTALEPWATSDQAPGINARSSVSATADGWLAADPAPTANASATVAADLEPWSTDGFAPAINARSSVQPAVDEWTADDVAPSVNARTTQTAGVEPWTTDEASPSVNARATVSAATEPWVESDQASTVNAATVESAGVEAWQAADPAPLANAGASVAVAVDAWQVDEAAPAANAADNITVSVDDWTTADPVSSANAREIVAGTTDAWTWTDFDSTSNAGAAHAAGVEPWVAGDPSPISSAADTAAIAADPWASGENAPSANASVMLAADALALNDVAPSTILDARHTAGTEAWSADDAAPATNARDAATPVVESWAADDVAPSTSADAVQSIGIDPWVATDPQPSTNARAVITVSPDAWDWTAIAPLTSAGDAVQIGGDVWAVAESSPTIIAPTSVSVGVEPWGILSPASVSNARTGFSAGLDAWVASEGAASPIEDLIAQINADQWISADAPPATNAASVTDIGTDAWGLASLAPATNAGAVVEVGAEPWGLAERVVTIRFDALVIASPDGWTLADIAPDIAGYTAYLTGTVTVTPQFSGQIAVLARIAGSPSTAPGMGGRIIINERYQ